MKKFWACLLVLVMVISLVPQEIITIRANDSTDSSSLTITTVKQVSDYQLRVTFSAPITILSDPFISLRLLTSDNSLLWWNAYTETYELSSKMQDANGNVIYKDTFGAYTTTAGEYTDAGEWIEYTAQNNLPMQWLTTGWQWGDDSHTTILYTLSDNSSLPAKTIPEIITYDWQSEYAGSHIKFYMEESTDFSYIADDGYLNNIVRTDNDTIALEGNFSYYNNRDYLQYDISCDFTYTVSDGKTAITGYSGIGGAVIIPSFLGGYPVTSIGSNAFYNCSGLTSITIPDSVVTIESSAFSRCSNLTSVTIPDSVTSIGSSAFYYCTSLTSIIVSDQNATYSSIDGVLFNKNKTTLFQYPAGRIQANYAIPDSVTGIDMGAFSYCTSLTSVTIPDSVKLIAMAAFHYCTSLTSITIPDSVTSIAPSAFYYCTSLTSVIVNDQNSTYSSIDGVLFNKNKTTLHLYPAGRTQATYTIPDSVTAIGGSAFYCCTSLTSIAIPDSVTSIGMSAFGGDYNLKSVWYAGSEEDRANITIEIGNDYLLNATWYYNFCGEDAHTYTDGCDEACNTCQWPRVGEHTYDNSLDKDCNLCGHARTFEEFPITAISAEPESVIEKTNGGWYTDSNSGNTYFQYYYNPNTCTLTMADGLTFTGYGYEISNLVGKYPSYSSDQSYSNQWGLGDHAVTLTLGNITGEFVITVIENPIQSITAEPVTVEEGTNSYLTIDYSTDERNTWLCYDLPSSHYWERSDQGPSLTLVMKDGTTFTGEDYEIYDLLGAMPSFSLDQSYTNQWGVGEHTATVSIGEVSCEFAYTITESPIHSIYVAPITIYEGINGYTSSDYFQYSYSGNMAVTVFYKNGSVVTGTLSEISEKTGMDYRTEDDQSSSNPWGLGAHKATIYLGHLSCELDITVAPDPIESIELVKLPKTEYITGEFLDLSGAVLRVHFNDDTFEDIPIQYSAIPETWYHNCNKVNKGDDLTVSFTDTATTRDSAPGCFDIAGSKQVTLSYFGQSVTFSVNVTEKTVQSLSINDDNKNLIITVTYTDNTTQELTALSFISPMGDATPEYSSRYGELRTDKGHYFFGFITYSDGSIYLSNGDISSNILQNGCDWYDIYLDQWMNIYQSSYPSFGGQVTAENIDYLLNYTYLTYSSEIDNVNGYLNVRELSNAFTKLFALDSIDLSLSSRYDSETDRYYLGGTGDAMGPGYPPSLIYENGYWNMTWPIDSEYISYAHFADDGRILKIVRRAPIGDHVKIGDTYYDTLEEALSAAISGDTIELSMDVVATDNCTVVNAGVTLDLNGHNLTVKNFMTFGDVVDTTEGEGKLIISDDTTKAFTNLQDNNSQMPLYDEDGYRFFTYDVVNKGAVTVTEGEKIKFGTHIQLSNRKAYELLGNGRNGNTAITFSVTCGEQTFDYTFKPETLTKFAQAVCTKYDNNAEDKTGTVLVLTISGLSRLESGTDISVSAQYHSTGTRVCSRQTIQ